jgi:hypothetical protein
LAYQAPAIIAAIENAKSEREWAEKANQPGTWEHFLNDYRPPPVTIRAESWLVVATAAGISFGVPILVLVAGVTISWVFVGFKD